MLLKFLVQTINGKVVHDFGFAMERSVEYLKWVFENDEDEDAVIEYCSLEDLSSYDKFDLLSYTPIGTVEFFYKYFKCAYGEWTTKHIKPLNIPSKLFKFTGNRNTNNYTLTASNRKIIQLESNMPYMIFLKSNERIKDEINGVYKIDDILDSEKIPDGDYQISEYVPSNDFVSEYRCFVYHDELLGIKNYSGDFTVFPDIDEINEMLSEYKYDYGHGEAPEAFTLDVTVTDEGKTEIVEVHEFFSCGLYGFDSYDKLPFMFKRISDKYKKEFEIRKNEQTYI